MDSGWIKLYRQTLDNGILADSSAWQVFCFYLLTADRKTGVTVSGRFLLSDALGLSPSTIYRAEQRLEKKWKIIHRKPNNKNTVITILHWAKFQGEPNNKRTTKEQQKSVKRTHIQEYIYKDNNSNNQQSISGEGSREGGSLPRNSRTSQQTVSNDVNLGLRKFLKIDKESLREKAKENWLRKAAKDVGMSVEELKSRSGGGL